MYQLNTFQADSAPRFGRFAAAQSSTLTPRIATLLMFFGFLFPGTEVFASYSGVGGNSNNSSVGVGNAVYKACPSCDDPTDAPVVCGTEYTLKPVAFDVSNNSVNPMMIQSVYSTITSPGGQVFSLTSENYYKVFATPWGEIYFTLNPPTTLLPGASMTISSRLSFIFCDDDPLNPTNIEPGDYQVYTYVSGIGGNGAPFTITLDYTFHVTVFGGGPPPSLRLSNPNADNITEMSWSPNPSQDVASFQFELAEASAVQIDLLDLQGKLVDRKAMVESLEAGTHTIKWNVADLPAGVYFARIKTAREERTVKWIKL